MLFSYVILFVKRDKLEPAFWLLCIMHAVIQVPPDGVVGNCDCRCHPFAACTLDVTVRFSRQSVSRALSKLTAYVYFLYSAPAHCQAVFASFPRRPRLRT